MAKRHPTTLSRLFHKYVPRRPAIGFFPALPPYNFNNSAIAFWLIKKRKNQLRRNWHDFNFCWTRSYLQAKGRSTFSKLICQVSLEINLRLVIRKNFNFSCSLINSKHLKARKNYPTSPKGVSALSAFRKFLGDKSNDFSQEQKKAIDSMKDILQFYIA